MSYIIDTASPAPGPLLKGRAGSGVGKEADGSTDLPDWGPCLNALQSTWSQVGSGDNSLDFYSPRVQFWLYRCLFHPSGSLLSHHYKGRESQDRGLRGGLGERRHSRNLAQPRGPAHDEAPINGSCVIARRDS